MMTVLPFDAVWFAMGERGEYLINYRVDDLADLIAQLQARGVATVPVKEQNDGRYPGNKGLFTWITVPMLRSRLFKGPSFWTTPMPISTISGAMSSMNSCGIQRPWLPIHAVSR